MNRTGIQRWLGKHFDGVDIWTMALVFARFVAFVAWTDVIVRALRGEESKENWKTFSSSAAFMGLSALQTGAEIRERASLRDAAVEMRHLVDHAAEQAKLSPDRAVGVWMWP
jgi:hypothetical protein